MTTVRVIKTELATNRVRAAAELRSRVEAEAYVASVCFKHGPPRLLGVELEWTVHHRDDPRRTLEPAHLIDALGAHAPATLFPDSPQLPLPSGSAVTVEPGGQVEISTKPQASFAELWSVTTADIDHLTRLLGEAGLVLGAYGIDAYRAPPRLLEVPRYAAMESAFNRIGADGRTMMCATAGLQVCLDAGEESRVPQRWAAVHALGPVLMAAFANSPSAAGAPTGWASSRMRSLFGTDPPRTRPGAITADPAASWARRVINTPLVCVRRPGNDWSAPSGITFGDWVSGALPDRPTRDDLDYHLTTMFPPVRPRGYLEVRYLDAQAPGEWVVPAVVLAALFSTETMVDAVLEITKPTIGHWVHAARCGLADPVLAATARAVFDLAVQSLDELDLPVEIAGLVPEALDRRLAKVAKS